MFVLKSKYEAMENRALNAEAAVREFERKASDRIATELATYEAKHAKKTKKIEVTDGTETTQKETPSDVSAARVIKAKEMFEARKTKDEIATDLGVSVSTVRKYLKK